MPGTLSKKFVFNNNVNELHLLVLTIIDDIKQAATVDEKTVSKLKMILVELLTNSLKHSGQQETIIDVSTTNDKISITKTDAGNGFAVRCNENLLEWPLPGRHHTDEIITIYNDSNAVLKAKLQNNCRLAFFVEEAEETEPVDINCIAEHFGLMIITRACDTFEYEFDIEKCINNFNVVLTIEPK